MKKYHSYHNKLLRIRKLIAIKNKVQRRLFSFKFALIEDPKSSTSDWFQLQMSAFLLTDKSRRKLKVFFLICLLWEYLFCDLWYSLYTTQIMSKIIFIYFSCCFFFCFLFVAFHSSCGGNLWIIEFVGFISSDVC